MTGKTHLAAGVCVGLGAVAYSLDAITGSAMSIPYTDPLYVLPIGYACCVVGSLFPDIDWQTSKVGQVVAPVSKVINFFFGHRTLFHSPLLFALLYIIIDWKWSELSWYAAMFVIGAASHLILDMFNEKGIPLFYPWKKHFHIARIRPNSLAEAFIKKLLYWGSFPTGLWFVIELIQRFRIIL